jgi:hypothetical protein
MRLVSLKVHAFCRTHMSILAWPTQTTTQSVLLSTTFHGIAHRAPLQPDCTRVARVTRKALTRHGVCSTVTARLSFSGGGKATSAGNGPLMIRHVLVGAVVAVAGFALAPNANAIIFRTAPSCAPGFFVNPDDLSGECLAPSPGNDYVALAVSPITGDGGWGNGATRNEAERIAVAQCVASSNSVCDVLASTHNGCAARAVDTVSGVYNGGIGANPDSASADALGPLQNGQMMYVECSKP